MGELQKRIGEFGEDVVGKFLERIGWGNCESNVDVPCVRKKIHSRDGKERKEHGIDFVYAYRSPLFSRRAQHVVGSVKFHKDGYPSSAKSKFKEYYLGLKEMLECYKPSELATAKDKGFVGVDHTSYFGLLFWLHNTESDDDVISQISNSQFPPEKVSRIPIAVIDNHRFDFLWRALEFLDQTDESWSFYYQDTGNNLEGSERKLEGDSLPVELLLGGPLVFRIHESDQKKMVLLGF